MAPRLDVKRALGTWRRAAREWVQDKCPRLAAALAYYTAFALAPLLLLVIAVAGMLWDSAAVRAAVVGQATSLVGPASAATIDEVLGHAQRARSGWLGATVAVAGFVIGATGVFGELQGALNTIWGVDVRKGGWRHALKTRVLSFSLIVVVGFLLLVSLVVSAAWHAVAARLRTMLDGTFLVALGTAVDLAVSLGLFTVLLAAIYKVLPDVRVQWRDTWVGAFATALLLALGKTLIGLYLGHSRVASAFGAAGSLAVILAWLYYTGLVLFLGAEYTQVRAEAAGRPLEPKPHAYAIQAVQRDEVAPARKGRRKPHTKA
ncbi:MAG TPA: YihY/virulence factor BrkB family protein [Candidatus Thermoplasmatota archaeon]|nr:YihY/virulence factor BrkB family protein [Candidatus Thermoplasmatota archaeon]